jgi:hypothetical protein
VFEQQRLWHVEPRAVQHPPHTAHPPFRCEHLPTLTATEPIRVGGHVFWDVCEAHAFHSVPHGRNWETPHNTGQ